MGSEDLGQHYYNLGDMGKAQSSFAKMRDYCTTPAHIISTAFRMISVVIEQKNWLGVQSQVNKVRALNLKQEEAARIQPKMSTAQGLSHMCQGEFKEAANAFLSTDFTLGDTYNEVISSNDVAVYGGLCALASMSRAELQSKVLENNNFRSFLELEPHIRRAINSFCASKYSQCLEILESYRVDYVLDIYLQDQLPRLYEKIRTKSIVQYFAPFSQVTLQSMEQMFGTSATSTAIATTAPNGHSSTTPSAISPRFLNELVSMVQSHDLDARIDLENAVLISHRESSRAVMQQRAIETVNDFTREARLKVLRLNAVNGSLDVKPVPKNTKGKDAVGGGMDLAGMIDTGNGGFGSFQGQGHGLRSGRG